MTWFLILISEQHITAYLGSYVCIWQAWTTKTTEASGVICKVNQMNHEFIRTNTKSPKFSHILNDHRQRVVSSYWNLAFSLFLLGWVKLGLYRPIWDLWQWVPCTYPTLNPKILSKFERRQKEVSKVSPNFQNRLRNTTSYQALNKSFLKER